LLCFGFGFWLCWQASRMKPNQAEDLLDEACEEVQVYESQHFGAKQVTQRSNQRWSVLLKAFSLTFLAEWGDRTQLATMMLAVRHPTLGVIVGSIVGHFICALIAVLGGRWVTGRISERWLTWMGGLLFIIFGVMSILAPVA
jgi:Ca2+/H+ antiporter, TMEM165/GDT1 family